MKKRAISLFICSFICIFLFSANAATNGAERVRDIVKELETGDVSPEWKADLLVNSEMIEEMSSLIQNFDQDQLAQIKDIEDSIAAYIKALYKEVGKDSGFVDNVFAKISPTNKFGTRASALDILTNLKNSSVSPDWGEDVQANEAEITKMLLLTKGYTEDELSAVTREERADMMAYFKGLYKLKGYNVQELEIVLAQKDIPGYKEMAAQGGYENGIKAYAEPQKPTMPEPLAKVHLANNASSINIAVAFILCTATFVMLVLLLKRHDEKRRHSQM
ncbi:MAG: hypothetical protein RR612_07645 [Oscillospiraceae bacterium]